MFRDALLESAPVVRRRNRWPMATAFTLELMAAAVFVLLPLISTGVIPLRATVIVPAPPKFTPIANRQPVQQSGGHTGPSFPRTRVITVATRGGHVDRNVDISGPADPDNTGTSLLVNGDPNGLSDLIPKTHPIPVRPPDKPVVISHTTEAMLMNKVVPEYPHIARITGMQGDVKLHAFVSKNGTITSLTVLGTPPPILAKAALDAVQQWKYRPYLLNGVAVEIETFITVTFKKSE